MFNGESDLNTNIVFSIPWVRAFELTRGKTDFSFFSFEYSDILIQGIFWSDYDINQYMILLLAYCCGNLSPYLVFFFFQSLSWSFIHIRDVRGDTTTTKLLYKDLPEPVAEYTFPFESKIFL